jgi:predicted TIM-barrel fold metal-dependent hydrolase
MTQPITPKAMANMSLLPRWSLRFGLVFAVSLLATSWTCGEEPQPFATKYRVINVHRHCDAPDERALEAELEVMDRVGIDVMVNLLMDGGWTTENLPAWMELKKKHPDRVVVFGYMDWSKAKQPGFSEYLVQEVRAQHRLGVQGIKVWKDLGMYLKDADGKLLKADDPQLAPFWAACGKLGLPVLYHCADPKEYWHPRTYNSFHYKMPDRANHYEDQNMPSWEELIRQRDAVLANHPDLVMIGAHMGSQCFDLAQLGETLDKYPNFHVECAARLRILGRLNPRAVRDFLIKYQDRVMFGTDRTVLGDVDLDDKNAVRRWKDKDTAFEGRYLEYFETDRTDIIEPYGHEQAWLRLAGVKLPPQVLEKFYHANAERLIPGLQPLK